MCAKVNQYEHLCTLNESLLRWSGECAAEGAHWADGSECQSSASNKTCFYHTLAGNVAFSPKRGQFAGMRDWASTIVFMQFSEDFLPLCDHLCRDMGMLPADAEYRTVCATEGKMQSPGPTVHFSSGADCSIIGEYSLKRTS